MAQGQRRSPRSQSLFRGNASGAAVLCGSSAAAAAILRCGEREVPHKAALDCTETPCTRNVLCSRAQPRERLTEACSYPFAKDGSSKHSQRQLLCTQGTCQLVRLTPRPRVHLLLRGTMLSHPPCCATVWGLTRSLVLPSYHLAFPNAHFSAPSSNKGTTQDPVSPQDLP